MRNGILKICITYILLALYLTIKMAGLHALYHSDDDHGTHCEVCEFVSSHNLTPTLAPEPSNFTIAFTELYSATDRFCSHEFLYTGRYSVDQLFSRPPPQVV